MSSYKTLESQVDRYISLYLNLDSLFSCHSFLLVFQLFTAGWKRLEQNFPARHRVCLNLALCLKWFLSVSEKPKIAAQGTGKISFVCANKLLRCVTL